MDIVGSTTSIISLNHNIWVLNDLIIPLLMGIQDVSDFCH